MMRGCFDRSLHPVYKKLLDDVDLDLLSVDDLKDEVVKGAQKVGLE